jgi:hypothetical protein
LIKAAKHIFNIQGTGLFAWFFVLYAMLGYATLHRYGVHYDELTQRSIGIENARYIAGWGKYEDVQQHKYFGPLFETPAYLLEQLVFTSPMQTKLLLRRSLLFTIFLLSVFAIYRIGRYMYQNHVAAMLTAMLYACWPRLFAEAHYNSKDVFFLCMGVFVLWALVIALQKQKFPWAACMLAGMASTVRIAGIFYFIPVLWILLHYRFNLNRIYALFSSIFIFILSWYLVYPAVWKSPWDSFIGIFRYVDLNPWPSPTVLAGELIKPGKVPAYYTFLWMLVTLPLIYIGLFFAGFYTSIKTFKKSPLVQYLIILFLMTVFYLIIQKPTLYNGWRHVYFIYMPIILMVGLLIDKIVSQIRLKKILAISVYLAFLLLYNIKHDFVYFNALKQLWKPGSFSMDYWGISTLHALNKIKEDESPKKIYAFTETIWLNKQLMGGDAINIQHVNTVDSADFVLVLNREGKLDFYNLPLIDTDVYEGDTLWKLHDRRSENLYSR